MDQGDAHQQIGYILRSYPRLSQTFILNEILALEKLGSGIQIFALTDPQEAIRQAQAAEIRAPVHYLEAAFHQSRARALLGHLETLAAHPAGYLRALLYTITNRPADAGYHAASRFECFSMAVYLVSYLLRQRRTGQKTVGHLHAHFAHDPALIALLAHMISGIPFSFTAHARDLYQLIPEALKDRAREARAIITCCAPNRDYLEEVIPEDARARIHLIYHGVDLETFKPLLTRNDATGKPFILSVGRLVPKKGFADLLGALRQLKQTGAAFRVQIYGEGPLQAELEELIHRYGLSGEVVLCGALLQKELLPLFQEAQIFALTPTVMEDGDRDGIPNVLVEAMACGLPVVTTAVAGIPELVIPGENGLLYEPQDVEGIAAGLAALLSDEGRRKQMGEQARKTVEERFDLKAAACQLANLYQQFGTV